MPKHEDVDEALFRWFHKVQAPNVPVSGLMLQVKARNFPHLYEHEGFNQLNGWIQHFKNHHGVSCRVTSGESREVDDVCTEAWFSVNLEALLSAYSDKDVYNANEAGVCDNTLPNQTLALKGGPCSSHKVSIFCFVPTWTDQTSGACSSLENRRGPDVSER